MELVATIFFAVELETSIAQREFAVCLASADRVGQYTTHRILAIIRHDALAEIHHATAFCYNSASPFGIVFDGFATSLVSHQRLQMLFRIAPRQIQQVDTFKRRHLRLRVEEPNLCEAVNRLLIQKRE